MIVIGERINSTRKNIKPAVENKDTAFIQEEASKQTAAGSNYLDVNAATMLEKEPEYMEWLVKTVQEVSDLPLSIDSPRAEAVRVGMECHRPGQTPLLNSLPAEEKRMAELLPIIQEFKPSVIALCMDDNGVPGSAEQRVEIAELLIGELHKAGIADENILVDPCIMPAGAPVEGSLPPGQIIIGTMRAVRENHPNVHIVSGLSNISYGLPNRKLVNRAACIAFMTAGMDAAIIDPTDAAQMSLIMAAEAVLGRDDYCMNYVTAAREEKLVF